MASPAFDRQDVEFVSAIREGREPESSAASCRADDGAARQVIDKKRWPARLYLEHFDLAWCRLRSAEKNWTTSSVRLRTSKSTESAVALMRVTRYPSATR